MAYTEQIKFLLFLKMADEQTRPPCKRKPIVPPGLSWQSLLARDGDELDVHYRHVLEKLGENFKKARPEIQNPATLRRRIVDLFDAESWLRDKSLEDSDDLPEPDVLAQEIADDLQTALDQFAAIAVELRR